MPRMKEFIQQLLQRRAEPGYEDELPSDLFAKVILPRGAEERLVNTCIVPERKLIVEVIKPSDEILAKIGTKIYITRDSQYIVCEKPLTKEDVDRIKNVLQDLFITVDTEKLVRLFNVDYYTGSREKIIERINDSIRELVALLKDRGLDERHALIIGREIFRYGKLDPLVQDPDIQDITVPSPETNVKIYHARHGILETNIKFSEVELDEYIEKLFNRINRAISLYTPLASVQLPEGHRLTVSYKREVTTAGSNLIIRKFPENPWSISRLLATDAIDPLVAGFMMMAIVRKKGVLIAGAMGSGKTSMLNGLLNFIPQKYTVVTIEDTPELRLSHPYWIQHITRESVTISGAGTITMFDLIKHALRESADYVIIGEIRGEEGRVWAQALATGHGGVTTFHAETARAAISRLTSDPINIEPSILSSLKVIGVMKRLEQRKMEDGRIKILIHRRLTSLYEVLYDEDSNTIGLRRIYSESNGSNNLEAFISSRVFNEIMEETGLTRDELRDELMSNIKFMTTLRDHIKRIPNSKYANNDDATRLIWTYYVAPNDAYKLLLEEEQTAKSN